MRYYFTPMDLITKFLMMTPRVGERVWQRKWKNCIQFGSLLLEVLNDK